MNLLRIIGKEIRHGVRDWFSNSLMILFPILLMSVLGVALSGVFSGSVDLDTDVAYTVRDDGELGRAFQTFRVHAEGLGVRFEDAPALETGILSVRGGKADAYVVVQGDGVVLYSSDLKTSEADLVRSLLSAFLERYNAVRAIASVYPAGLASLGSQGAEVYTRTVSLDGNRAPRAVDYYSVTMLTLLLFYGSMFGMTAVSREIRLKTRNRILCAPVGPWQLLGGKTVGGILVTALQIVVVMAFSRFVLGAYWGDDLFTVGLILAAESAMVVAMGAGIAYLLPNEGAAIGLLNMLIPLLGWFGGSYVPAEVMGPKLSRIGVASPLHWINRAILDVVYRSDYTAVAPALAMCLGVGAIFLAAAAILSRKERT